MASKMMGLMMSPVVNTTEPEVWRNSVPGSRVVLFAKSCQNTVTLPKYPLSLRTLEREVK